MPLVARTSQSGKIETMVEIASKQESLSSALASLARAHVQADTMSILIPVSQLLFMENKKIKIGVPATVATITHIITLLICENLEFVPNV